MSDSQNASNPETRDDQGQAGDELSQVTRQRDEYLDQLQRTRAEFVNYQKRSKAQAESERGYLVGSLASDILSAMDNFDRATEAARAANATAIVEGLDMVSRQLLGALGKHGIEPIQATGLPFDPNQHDAVMQQPTADHPEGTVVAELAKGYRLKDRVLRPAKVAVSVKP